MADGLAPEQLPGDEELPGDIALPFFNGGGQLLRGPGAHGLGVLADGGEPGMEGLADGNNVVARRADIRREAELLPLFDGLDHSREWSFLFFF